MPHSLFVVGPSSMPAFSAVLQFVFPFWWELLHEFTQGPHSVVNITPLDLIFSILYHLGVFPWYELRMSLYISNKLSCDRHWLGVLSGTYIVVSGIENPTRLMRIFVIYHTIMSQSISTNSSGRKPCKRSSSTFPNNGPTSGVMVCTKFHLCWMHFWTPVLGAFGWKCIISSRLFTTYEQLVILLAKYSFCVAAFMVKPTSYHIPVMNVNPMMDNNFCTHCMFHSEMTNMLYVIYCKYPCVIPCIIKSFRWDLIF